MPKREWLVILLLLLISSGWRAHHLFVLGTHADEGVHAVVVSEITQGTHLYADLFENRTPGVFWLLAGVGRFLPEDLFLWRWLTWGMGCITTVGLWRIGRLVTASAWGGAAAALIFAAAPLTVLWGRHVMLEPFVAVFTVLAIWAALEGARRRSTTLALISGLMIGLAVLAKQSAAITVPAVAFFWLTLPSTDRADRGRLLLAWSAGGAAVLAALLSVLWATNALNPFLATLSGLERAAPLENLTAKGRELVTVGLQRPLTPLAIFGLAALVWRRPSGSTLLLAWAAAELAAVGLTGDLDLQPGGFSHYAVPAIAALSAVGGAGLIWGVRAFPVRWRGPVVAAMGALILLTLPGWWGTFSEITVQPTYPQTTQMIERSVGKAAAALAAPEDSILVFGNAIIYYWADRRPAGPFFHYPSYFSEAPIGRLADNALAGILNEKSAAVVIASRMHLDDRLSPPLLDALRMEWEPVALFSYPYQRDLFLFVPQSNPAGQDPAAAFANEINLQTVTAYYHPQAEALLVRLTWKATDTPAEAYTAFVHLVDSQGELIAQHDGVPAVGFRPTTGWAPGETITDWHWISIGAPPPASALSMGLYQPETNDRLLLAPETGLPASDHFLIPLADVLEVWDSN